MSPTRRYRRRHCWRCETCGKTAFSSYRRAERAAHKLPEPGRIYWPPCGGWHITRLDREEYDRRRALPEPEREGEAA